METTFTLGRLGQIALPVSDLDRATTFYRDRLKLRFLFGAPRMAFFDCDGVRLMLAIPEGETAGRSGSILYFRVEDVGLAHRTLAERGVEFVQPPRPVARMADHELWMAFFRDSEGNVLALMAEVKPAG